MNETIQYHEFYAIDIFVRVGAYRAEEERQMRECLGNRENYDIEGIRAVVAHWASIAKGSRQHSVALAILAEREAEQEYEDEVDAQEWQRELDAMNSAYSNFSY